VGEKADACTPQRVPTGPDRAAAGETFNDEYADLFSVVKELNQAGSSLQAITDELNATGNTTRRSKPWNRMQVSGVLKRAA
jgi:hypothetical protein